MAAGLLPRQPYGRVSVEGDEVKLSAAVGQGVRREDELQRCRRPIGPRAGTHRDQRGDDRYGHGDQAHTKVIAPSSSADNRTKPCTAPVLVDTWTVGSSCSLFSAPVACASCAPGGASVRRCRADSGGELAHDGLRQDGGVRRRNGLNRRMPPTRIELVHAV